MNRFGIVLAVVVLAAVAAPAARGAPRMSAAAFEYISRRTPSVFDNFYEFSRAYESRKPRLLVHVEPVFGPYAQIPTDKGDLEASLSNVKLTFGSVLYAWDRGGVSLRFDWQALGLGLHKGKYFPDKTVGWGYQQGLWTASWFHNDWRVTGGAFLSGRPSVAERGGQTVFVADESQETENDHVSATDKAAVGGFIDLSVPYFDVALIIDADGLDRLKAANRWKLFSVLDSFGPFFATFPKVDSYQLGLYADDYKILGRYLVVSAETAMRYEVGQGVAFDHALLKVATSLFVDDPKRELCFRKWRWRMDDMLSNLDFHIRIQAHGSYYNTPDSRHGFGGGGMVEFLSFGWLGIEGNVSVAVSWNYYEDLIELPITDVLTGRLRLVLGF